MKNPRAISVRGFFVEDNSDKNGQLGTIRIHLNYILMSGNIIVHSGLIFYLTPIKLLSVYFRDICVLNRPQLSATITHTPSAMKSKAVKKFTQRCTRLINCS